MSRCSALGCVALLLVAVVSLASADPAPRRRGGRMPAVRKEFSKGAANDTQREARCEDGFSQEKKCNLTKKNVYFLKFSPSSPWSTLRTGVASRTRE